MPPGRSPDYEFNVDFFGQRYKGNINSEIDWFVYFFGAFSPQELQTLKTFARYYSSIGNESVVYFDIGANVGHHVLFMAPFVEQVYAFEPFEFVRNRLNEKVRINKLSNVEVIPYALGNQSAVSKYFPSKDFNEGIGSLVPNFSTRNHQTGIDVEVCIGDDFVKKMNLRLPNILKVDVEGYERYVLDGLAQTINKSRPLVIMELSKQSKNIFENEATLRNLLYQDAQIFQWHSWNYGFKVGNGSGFDLTEVNFDTATDIVVIPDEHADGYLDFLRKEGLGRYSESK
jgi:FkbM family methyltransferase